jgi:hypothetical protein
MKFVTSAVLGASMAAAMAFSAPASAAVIYDAVNDFHGGVATGTWSYGTGTGGLSFTPMTVFSTACEGAAGISCWQTPTPVDRVPLVAKNMTGSTVFIYNTVVQPTDVLNVHPGPVSDAIVRFTAPTSGLYSLTGFFETLDTKPNGVVLSLFHNNASLGALPFLGAAAVAPGTPGGSISINLGLNLVAGDRVDFVVNNGGSYYNDSTGLSATFSTGGVPEPTTWALMIGGFGLAGAALRRRRAAAAV